MTLRVLAAIIQAAAAHETYEARTANSTEALAWITGVLGIGTIVLATYTALLWRATKKLAADAADTAQSAKDDAKRVREVMASQQEAMEAQAEAARDQATHTEANAKILERQFSATFRPRLVLRRITFAPPGEAGAAPKMKIELADVGFGGAVVTRFSVSFFPTDEAEGPEPWRILLSLEGRDGDGGHPSDLVVPVGGSVAIFAEFGEPGPSPLRQFAKYAAVYCAGYVQYTSAERIGSYRLGFIRACDTRDRIFRRVDNPDFEYQD